MCRKKTDSLRFHVRAGLRLRVGKIFQNEKFRLYHFQKYCAINCRKKEFF
jgi:hypothetical protein